jgi:hypothetical protein
MRHHVARVALLALAASACSDLTTGPDAESATLLPTHEVRENLFASSAPELVTCPSSETYADRKTIGLFGGTLRAGGSSITIPFGAVLLPTTFELIVPPSPYMEIEIHAVGMQSYLFLLPATIRIDYSRCEADAIPTNANLQGVYIDDLTKTVLELLGGQIDRTNRVIRFPTIHLSGYAVAY